jgi:N-acetyl-anhydromuramoyl-L-alanine amidase
MSAIVAYAIGQPGLKDRHLQVDIDSGLLRDVKFIMSPNCDARPAGIETDLIVVHGISLPPGEFGGPWIERLFTNSLPPEQHEYFASIGPLRVSSHVVISRGGELTQYVKFTDRAWHAGVSRYQDRAACNDFSVGVELEGTDHLPYEPAQYQVLAEVIAALCAAYPSFSPERVVGHSDIAPGRKTDPGPAFDWPHACRLIGAACQAPA